MGAEPPIGGALSGFHRRLCSPLVTLEGKTKAIRTGGVDRQQSDAIGPLVLLFLDRFGAKKTQNRICPSI